MPASHIRVAYRYLAAAALGRGETTEHSNYRAHRYADSLRVTDLTFAGKRGKKVEEFWVSWWRGGNDPRVQAMMEDWFEYATRAPSYKHLVATIETGLSELMSEGIRLESGTHVHRGVDVTPPGFTTIRIKNNDVSITSEYGGFTVKDLGDRYNEPTCIARGKQSVKQFYRWVKDNEAKIKQMSFREVLKGMDAEGIDYHYYCAMD